MGGKVGGMSGWAKEKRSKYEWVILVPCQPFLRKGWWGWSRDMDLKWLSVVISEGHSPHHPRAYYDHKSQSWF